MAMFKAALTDVPETMLWTLHNRAVEAMRDDGIIHDEKAIAIYREIDYDYEKYFGKAEPSHAVRSLDFDREIKAFLTKYPTGVIINLGEGLETQRYRIDEGESLWFSIDLPEAMAVRERFIKPDERHVHLAMSAIDHGWFDKVPKDRPVFISAQGLFMYFTEQQVESLIRKIDQNFKQYSLMFDTIPEWLSRKTQSEQGWPRTDHYKTPKMPWGIDRNVVQTTLSKWVSKNAIISDIGYSQFPRGKEKWVFFFLSVTPLIKRVIPSIVKIEHYS